MNNAYTRLLEHLGEIHALQNTLGLLSWDQETYMPPRGLIGRAQAREVLSGIVHDKVCDPKLGDLLDDLQNADLTAAARVNVTEFKRDRDRSIKLPRDLVTELARVTTLSQQAWVSARETDDWPVFAPLLEQVVELRRRQADVLGYEGEPYNALLDEFEPGARVKDLDTLFTGLRDHLIPLVAAIGEKPQHSDTMLHQEFSVDGQKKLSRTVLQLMGFDFQAGRLDTSAHPFTSEMSPLDVRLTTHFDPNDLNKSLYSTIHEGGHGLYEQGLPVEHAGTPLAQAISLGIHESQSRLWENMVGRSMNFTIHALPILRDLFPGRFVSATTEDLYKAVNVVKPSLVRIEADEITYNLHIILRMELERAVIADNLQVADLPAAWNQGMEKYLGLTPPTDRQGVLQDIHWSFGLFGYFPTYTLGNLYAAQFYEAIARDLPDLPQQVQDGDLSALLAWLRDNVHRHGRSYTPDELSRRATGAPLSAKPLMDYLDAKFGALYGL
jgi:carboxypeptidase Taq